MKIIILDGYDITQGDLDWSALEALGDLTVYEEQPDDRPETILQAIGDGEIVVVNKAPIDRTVLDACPNLRFIAEIATGFDQIDTAYAREKNIPVSNVPQYGTHAVAQFTIALLLELTCHVGLHNTGVHAGKWEAAGLWPYCEAPLVELDGKTIGIIGFGSIGRQVGRVAKALGMQVLAYSRSEHPDGRAIGRYVDLDTLLAQSDVVSLHCPLTPDTAQIINKSSLQKMKNGSILLNTGRGGLVDEQALADALNSGYLRAAAVDVVSKEPVTGDNPLLHAPHCIITPHIAWMPKETRQRLIEMTAENIAAFLAGNPIHVIN